MNHSTTPLHVTALMALALVLLASGCADDDVTRDDNKGPKLERARFKTLSTAGRDVRGVDLNHDSKPDQWYIAAEGKVIRVERDLNFDGLPDVYIYPDAGGQPLEEEMDLDVDGNIDVVSYYKNGVLTRQELSIDFTGALGVIKYYDTEGELSRVERDTDADGKVDVWEYYQDKRKVRTGRDLDRDGAPDVFDEAAGS